MRMQKAPTLGRVLLFWATTMFALAIIGPVAAGTRNAEVATGVFTVPVTFVLTLLFIRWEHKSPADFGFTTDRHTWLRFVAGIVLGFVLIGAQTTIMRFAGGIRWTLTAPEPAMLFPLVGYLLLATREELAFRGYPLRSLASKMNPWLAQTIVAALFVVEHRLGGATWENALLGSGIGSLVFGMAALTTGGLALPIGLHAAWNIGDWARGGKGDGGLWRTVVSPHSAAHVERVATASYVGIMLCAIVSMWMARRAFREQTG